MGSLYRNTVLTVIALTLAAIAAKLYIPAASSVGSQFVYPTRGDFEKAREIKDKSEREERIQLLQSRMPVVRIDGGSISVSGSVDVSNTVTVESLSLKEERERREQVQLQRDLETLLTEGNQ